MTDDTHSLRSGSLTATIKAHGAELCSLKDSSIEFLWQAGPEWPRHAPLLFPIVGRLANDELRHRGKAYRMTQHGFARDRRFVWAERGESRCALVLVDDEATRALYPFAFRLCRTPSPGWPTGSPARPLRACPTSRPPRPTPRSRRRARGRGSRRIPSRAVQRGRGSSRPPDSGHRTSSADLRRPATSSGPWLKMSWRGFRELGIWSKPSGAPFLCIEPWRGHASPAGFDGEFTDKPGLMHIAPDAEESLSYRIEVGSS